MSPYNNLKLLVRDGKLSRNMKKFIEDGKIRKEIMSNVSGIKQGILKTDNVVHAVSYIESVGVLYTTKNQRNNDGLMAKDDKSFVYTQIFGNNKITSKNEIKNDDLIRLLNRRGDVDALYANLYILKIRSGKIIFNDNNKQFLRNIEVKYFKKSEEFLLKCGGIDKVKRVYEHNEFRNNVLRNSQRLLYELSNAKPYLLHKKYMEGKKVHDILIELEKEKQLDFELFQIKIAIEKIII